MAASADDPIQLLTEWFEWWSGNDDAPAKLPDALQVRTAIALTGAGVDVTDLLVVVQPELEGMPPPVPSVPVVSDASYLLKATVRTRNELMIDLASLVRENLDEYRETDLSGGFVEWERPVVFVEHHLHEMISPMFFGGHVNEGFWDTFELVSSWNKWDFEEFLQVCPEATVSGET